MGKASIILVLAFAMISATTRMSMQRTIGETVRNVAADYERMAARNIANSGAYVALQTVSEDNTWRAGFDSVSFAGGQYYVTVEDSTADPTLGSDRLRLTGTGECGDVSHTVRVVIEGENQIPPIPGAVGVSSNSTSFSFSGEAFNIDGRDTNAGDDPLIPGSGPGPDLPGLTVSNAADSAACVDEPKSDGIVGTGDPPSVRVSTDDPPDLEALAQWLRPRADFDLPGGNYGPVTWGTFASPAIVYIDGNADIAGSSSGAGILVVNGNLKLAGSFSWQGMVIVFGTELTVATASGTPAILGAFLIQSDTAAFNIAGHVDITYSSQTIESAHDKLDVNFYRLVSWYE